MSAILDFYPNKAALLRLAAFEGLERIGAAPRPRVLNCKRANFS
jgi:hypothetical protein